MVYYDSSIWIFCIIVDGKDGICMWDNVMVVLVVGFILTIWSN